MHLHPHIAAELNRQRRADMLAAAEKARLVRELRRQRRHPLTALLAAAVSAARGRWRGLRPHPAEAEIERSTTRELRSESRQGLATTRETVQTMPVPASPAATQAPVTSEEQDELAALLEAMSVPNGPIERLNTQT